MSDPVAIVGYWCIGPGFLSPEELWEKTSSGGSLLRHVNFEDWKVRPEHYLKPDGQANFLVGTGVGGYVDGDFTDWNGKALRDKVFGWLHYCARRALDMARMWDARQDKRFESVIGNLSYPVEGMMRYTAQHYLGSELADKLGLSNYSGENFFMSGYPVQDMMTVSGLLGRGYSIDAACASSLYTMDLGIKALARGDVDLALVGGVNASEDFYVHCGFEAMQALSQQGDSQPFGKNADGLIPAQGCGVLVMKRLEEAQRDGDVIYGVVGGVGLSNDGNSGSLLSPSTERQQLALRRAYEGSGMEPGEVDYIESHATGTVLGDGAELTSIEGVFGRRDDLVLGGLKGNIGHALTASGVFSVIRGLEAIQRGGMPQVRTDYELSPASKEVPFQFLSEVKPWDKDKKRAKVFGVNAFGMGGCNAHIVVKEYLEADWKKKRKSVVKASNRVAVVGVEVESSAFQGSEAFFEAIMGSGEGVNLEPMMKVQLPLRGMKFPPNDLKNTQGQQLLMLKLGFQAMKQVKQEDWEHTGVYIGQQCHPKTMYFWLRPQLEERLKSAGLDADEEVLERFYREFKGLEASHVLGAMPNVTACRLNFLMNSAEVGYSVSEEEHSGVRSLMIAAEEIMHGRMEVALVGGVQFVDLDCEKVALESVGVAQEIVDKATDGGVMLVLKSEAKAKADGDKILSYIDVQSGEIDHCFKGLQVLERVGYSHSASGLMGVAGGVLMNYSQMMRDARGEGVPMIKKGEGHRIRVDVESFMGTRSEVVLQQGDVNDTRPVGVSRKTLMCVFSADSVEGLIAQVGSGQQGGEGRYRAVVIAPTASRMEEKIQWLLEQFSTDGEFKGKESYGVFYNRGQLVEGEKVYLFSSSNTLYKGVGRELALMYPECIHMMEHIPDTMIKNAFRGLYLERERGDFVEDIEQGTIIQLLHINWCKEVLGWDIKRVMGHSLGEVNAMFALGICGELEKMYKRMIGCELFTQHLSGEYRVLGKVRNGHALWANYRFMGDVDKVAKRLEEEQDVYLTIINSGRDAVLAGSPEDCDRVMKDLGIKGQKLPVNIVVHNPVAHKVEKLLTYVIDGPYEDKGYQFYSCNDGGIYQTAERSPVRVLNDVTQKQVDFPQVVEAAYADGVRKFIEVGAGGMTKGWVREILGDRPAVVVSVDEYGKSGIEQLYYFIAGLWVSGEAINLKSVINNIEDRYHVRSS